jgi:hypothetical protein
LRYIFENIHNSCFDFVQSLASIIEFISSLLTTLYVWLEWIRTCKLAHLFYLSGSLYCFYCLVCCSGVIKGKVLLVSGVIFHLVLAYDIFLFNKYSEEPIQNVLYKALPIVILWIIHSLAQTSLASLKNSQNKLYLCELELK